MKFPKLITKYEYHITFLAQKYNGDGEIIIGMFVYNHYYKHDQGDFQQWRDEIVRDAKRFLKVEAFTINTFTFIKRTVSWSK